MKSSIQNLDSSKENPKDNVLIAIIKSNASIFVDIFHEHTDRCIPNSQFPDSLKVAEVVTILKKAQNNDYKNLKSSYRSVSILPNVSKLFERSIFDQ